MTKPIFKTIDSNETRLDYKGHKFLLIEQSRGVYGMGRSIQLYQMEGLKKQHVKELGWTKTDHHNGPEKSDAFLKGIVNLESCKKAAVKYIDSII